MFKEGKPNSETYTVKKIHLKKEENVCLGDDKWLKIEENIIATTI